MTAVEHLVAWIESSRPHYDRLLTLTQNRNSPVWSLDAFAESALRLVVSAYREMIRDGDAFASDWTPADLLDSAKALMVWELEQ